MLFLTKFSIAWIKQWDIGFTNWKKLQLLIFHYLQYFCIHVLYVFQWCSLSAKLAI